MNFRNTRARRRDAPTLEITPLIDVVFLLLLFFLLTSNFVRDDNSRFPLDLPSAGAGESATEGARVTVFLDAEGNLRLDDEQVRPEELPERLKALYQKEPATQILIKGDKGSNYGRITDIIDAAKAVGFERVNLVVKPRP